VGVVAVEAEVVDVAAKAEDDHLRPLLKRKTTCIYFFYQKFFLKNPRLLL
jgi:hypothetical protein